MELEKALTASPSFNEFFDENGHMRLKGCGEGDQPADNKNMASRPQTAQTVQTTQTAQTSQTNLPSTDSDQEVTSLIMNTNDTTTSLRAAPQSLCCGEFMSTFNNQTRPSSSYSKTRTGFNPNSSPQLNLTPSRPITEEETLNLNHSSLVIEPRTPSTVSNAPNTATIVESSNVRTPLEATEIHSPPAPRSSFFLPETPPAPKTVHALVEDKEHISQLSLQPHIEDIDDSQNSPLSYMPTLRPPMRTHNDIDIDMHRNTDRGDSPMLFSSLPLDALHTISGFLTAEEWCNVGLVSKDALVSCREVLKKLKIHGFKCAVEVISAWELGEHGDAKELAGLYLKSGVPIYPAPFGHEYHTINWRMKMEVKEMNPPPGSNTEDDENETGNHETQTASEPNPDAVTADRFYTDRIESRTEEYNKELSYLEEKAIFWRNVCYAAKGIIPEITRNTQNQPQRVNIRPIPPPLPAGFGYFALFDEDEEDANFNHIMEQGRIIGIGENVVVEPGNEHLLHIEFGQVPQRENEVVRTRQAAPRRSSLSRLHANMKMKGFKVPMKCHKHLADRHTERQAAVNDEKGTMIGRALSLSADFFHPVEQKSKLNSNPLPNKRSDEGNASALSPILRRKSSSFLTEHNAISSLDLQIYSFETDHLHNESSKSKGADSRSRNSGFSLREIVDRYEKQMLSLLEENDYGAFDECMLDFWDEFYKVTATVHFYDKFTPVPRMPYKRSFLSRPCPKAFGTVQCEIERIKVYHKGKGVNVTGRLFPTYEYRLFIRDRRRPPPFDGVPPGEEFHPRVDTLLMTAKHRSRNYSNSTKSSSLSGKRGVNNYHFYMPHQEDIENHLDSVNETIDVNSLLKGFRQKEVPGSHIELGRLQSNFIGTEFQIFSSFDSAPTNENMEQACESNTVDPNMNSVRPKKKKKKRSRNFLRRKRKSRRQSDETESNISSSDNRNRKGRIIPWSSFSKKRISRNAVADAEQSNIADKEIGAITYTANLLGNRPRVMDVCIPKINDRTGVSIPFEPSSANGEESSILSSLKTLSNQQNNTNQANEGEDTTTHLDSQGLLSLQNRPPWWNVELGAFVLNFGGRVSVASVKNFQLCDRNDHENIMLQFGRIEGRHSFTMDFSYPLSPLQAFAIAVSSLQSKISFA